MDCSTPGLPVHHQLLEFTQTHVHWVGDAIQPSHPLLSPSPLAFNLFPASGSFQMSQFFISGGQSIGVSASASVLPMNTQDWSPLGWTGWISLQSKGLSRVFSNTYASVKWQMATTHRSPYCPKIIKIVHIIPPNAQKLKFVSTCWNACLRPHTESTSEKDPVSLCPLPSHDHAHWHHSIFFFFDFSSVCLLNVCPSFGKWAPWAGTSRGCFTALSPPPETVSGTQKVFKKCWLNKWILDSTVPPSSFFHIWSKNTNLSSYYKNVNS